MEFLESGSDVEVFGGVSNSAGKNILTSLEAVYLCDVYVQEERIAVVFSVNYRCSDGRCSFQIEHKADSAKVADMHEARARKMSDVIGEAKILDIKITPLFKVWVEAESILMEIGGS